MPKGIRTEIEVDLTCRQPPGLGDPAAAGEHLDAYGCGLNDDWLEEVSSGMIPGKCYMHSRYCQKVGHPMLRSGLPDDVCEAGGEFLPHL